jgi:hypothetical protein
MHEGDAFCHTECAALNTRFYVTRVVMRGKNDHDRAANFYWIRSSFLMSVAITEFQTTETYPSLRVAGVCDDYDDECGIEEYHMEQVIVPSVKGISVCGTSRTVYSFLVSNNWW